MKARVPKPFSGEDRSALETFVGQCRLVFLVNPESFPSEQQKVLYASSYLEGIAYSWFDPILRKFDPDSDSPAPEELSSFKSFSASLSRMFGDPDLVRTKTRELRALRQTTSVAAYASEFQRLQAFISWNNQAFYDQFYDGLRENVKDGLAHAETRAGTFEELVQKAQKIDNRIAERITEKKSSHPLPASSSSRLQTPSASTRPPPAPPASTRPQVPPPPPVTTARPPSRSAAMAPSPAPDGTTPMELDTNRRVGFRPKLTATELQYRRVNNLCVYCGEASHYTRECPQKAVADLRRAQYDQRRLTEITSIYHVPSEPSTVQDDMLSEKAFAQE